MKLFFNVLLILLMLMSVGHSYEKWFSIEKVPSYVITANTQGRVLEVFVKQGQTITANTVLLDIADPLLDEKLEQLKNRYESAQRTFIKQEQLFKKNKIDYSEYNFALSQLNDASNAYYQFLNTHNQKIKAEQKIKIQKVYVKKHQDIYYGMSLFQAVPQGTYFFKAHIPFEYLKKLGINKKVKLFDEKKREFSGTVESLDIRGRDFFVAIKIKTDFLIENQKLKLVL